jgi:hypothetical protein
MDEVFGTHKILVVNWRTVTTAVTDAAGADY